MEILFKLNDTSVDLKIAIVGDTDFQDFYAKVNINNAWKSLKNYIEQATENQLLPFVGEAFYNTIALAYNNNTSLSTTQLKALRLMKFAVAYYAAQIQYIENMDTSTDAGNFQNMPTSANPSPIATFKIKLQYLTETADKHLDTLLAYMDERVKLNDTGFSTYANSLAYLKGKSDLFRTTEEFQSYHNICNSRRTFLALHPFMRDAARLYVMPLIGQDMFNELVQQYNDNGLTTYNAVLLDYVRPTLAKYTVMLAASMNGLKIEADGFRIVSNTDGFDSRTSAITARRNEVGNLKFEAEDYAKQYSSDLTQHLNANITHYQTYQTQMANANDTLRASKIVTSPPNFEGKIIGGIGVF
jgi:hypothetical protein